ncbi:glycosyltransferase family 4 protein [Paenibacillus lupini]|uniref:glycosyltransferase family 4 protein n=1 Tax=Paenibacillus lupini TaxID=1450204 RepID=UPI0014248A4A|nr:glycosyltransferase family 4 protein [Paenibacillus lupini]
MRVLTTGLGWNELQPGGLNRYYVDYNQALKQYGHSEFGLVVAEQNAELQTSLNITNAAGSGIWSRIRAVRHHTVKAVESFRPDVFNPHFALYASMVSRNSLPSHIPIVTHFHGPWALESKMEEGGKPRIVREARYLIKKQVEQVTYRRSDRFIVLSEYFRDILSNNYGIDHSKIHIIPGAVEHERFTPHPDRPALRAKLGIAPGQKLLFCARRIVRRMGIDRLIDAMQTVVREHPGSRLYIAGDGPMRSEYEQQIVRLGLSANVRMLGRVSNEELVEWYQAADYSIVPTITLEGFGLVTIESMACGTPVFGTPYGGTNEILRQVSSDLLFEDGTAEAMSGKLISALNGRLTLPTREACREHVLQRYTWSSVAGAVTDVFREAQEIRRKGVASR